MQLFLQIFLCLICTSVTTVSAIAHTPHVLLPKPNGTYEVGVSTMELIDPKRLQIFSPTTQQRKLMISLFYPVHACSAVKPVSYMPPRTVAFEVKSTLSLDGLKLPTDIFEKLALQVADESSGDQKSLESPIVLFSPAQGTTRLFYNAIAQRIASDGYIVVTIDAPYDVDIVEYPDGSTIMANTTVAADPTIADVNLAVATRAQDASFVLDQLRNASIISNLIPGASHGLNVSKVAMFGHSLGGAATAAAMLNDTRIVGGLAMDGALYGPVVQKGLDRPFMLMAHTNHTRSNNSSPDDPANTWFDIWPHLRGWKLDIRLANSGHYTFSDYPIVLETLGVVPDEIEMEKLLVTSMEGRRALKLVTTYVGAFLDMVLKFRHEPLLQGPVDAFPEVSFER